MAAEELVLQLLRTTNRPYNAQLVTDMLATKGMKKGPAEKALEALSAQEKLVRKEFGKQKIYYSSQEGLATLSPEESAARQQRLREAQEAAKAEEEAVAALRREVAAAGSVLTLEQMRQQLQQLGEQKAAQGEKLAALKSGGARRVSAADVAAVEKAYQGYFEAWARHRRQFRAVWDCVAEGMEGKEENIFEEMGVESDKAAGADFDGARALVQPLKKPRTALAPIRR